MPNVSLVKRCAIVIDDRWWESTTQCTGEAVVRSSQGPYAEAWCALHAEVGDTILASGRILDVIVTADGMWTLPRP